MADETKIIQFNRGATQQWANQVRPQETGEPGYDITAKELKIGDGETSFADLPAFLNKDNALALIPPGTPDAPGILQLATAAEMDGDTPPAGKAVPANLVKTTSGLLDAIIGIGEIRYLYVIRPGYYYANGQVIANASVTVPKLADWLVNGGGSGFQCIAG